MKTEAQKVLLQLRLMGVCAKVERVSRELAKKAGVPDGDEAAYAAWMDASVMGIGFNKLQAAIPQDEAGRLNAFRKAVGEETWAGVCNNPSLPQMLKEWYVGELKNHLAILVEDLKIFFKDTEVTDEDAKNFVYLQFV